MLQFLLRPHGLAHHLCCSTKRHSRNYSKKFIKERPNYTIERPTKADYDCILHLMHTAYYPEEPTCMSLAFKPTGIFDSDRLKALDEGLSLLYRCRCTNDILAVSINCRANPWDPDEKDLLACQVDCTKSRHLLHFYAYMQRAPDLWKKCGVQKIFEVENVFVRRDQRKKGMAFNIMQDSRTLAADAGFTLVRIDATSEYSARLCEKMGMKLVKFIPYCSYVGEDKMPIFKPPEPHLGVKIYVDDNPQKNYRRTPWKKRKRDPEGFAKF